MPLAYLKTLFFLSGEIALVAAIICLLFRFRKTIGLSPLYVFIGSYQYLQTVLAATVYLPLPGGYSVSPGSAVLFASSLFAILLVYLREDVPQTRSLIYGIVLSNLTLTALSYVTHWEMQSGIAINLLEIPSHFFQINPRIFLAGTLVLICDSVLIVVVYEYLFFRARWVALLPRILGALFVVLCFDSIAFTLLSFGGSSTFWSILGGQLLGKTFAALLFSLLLYIYLVHVDESAVLERSHPAEMRDVFSILTFREKYEHERLQREEQARRHAAEQASAAHALRISEENYRQLYETSKDGIVLVDSETERILSANPAMAALTLYSVEELSGRKIGELMPDGISPLLGSEFPDFRDLSLLRRDGGLSPVEYLATSHMTENRLAWQCHFRDVSQRVMAEAQLMHDAFHDRLTSLPNRALFVDRVDRLLVKQARDPGHRFAVLYLDVDRFKNVNDSLGHAAGDRLLIAIGQRLFACLRDSDTIARLGGDEFGILLDSAGDAIEATHVVERIESALRESFLIDSTEITATVSTGIVISSQEYTRPEEILRDADTAMYRAKAHGKARHEIFDQSMHDRVVAMLTVESQLRGAAKRGEIVVHYQPIFDIETGEVIGNEALVRWQLPGQEELVQPGEFISIAEETGLIIELGAYILRTAAAQTKRWVDELGKPLRLSVNVSVRQLQQAGFRDMVASALADTGLDPSLLHLELTESTLMDDMDATRLILEQTRALGVGFAIDDFGTGWSSLSYLRRLPIDSLKIDRSFVADSHGESDAGAIAAAIISLANSLGIEAIAEGVETFDQLERIRQLGCRFAQGFMLARPSSAEIVTTILRGERVDPLPASLWIA